MKVLYLISGLGIGGAEQIVRELSTRLSIRENDVVIVTLTGNPLFSNKNPRIKIISLRIKKSFISFLTINYKLYKIIKIEKPDIVHSHMYHSNIFARLTKIFLKIPILISSAHSNNEGGIFRMFMYRITNFLSDAFTNVSQDAINEFEKKRAVSKNKMLKIYNGINIDLFTKNYNLERTFDVKNPIFLSVGSLTKLKDHENLINAFYLLLLYFLFF